VYLWTSWLTSQRCGADMVAIVPLSLRFVRSDWTDRVPSPAHDSVRAAERQAYLEVFPDSYMAVTRSIEDLPAGVEMTLIELLEEGRRSLDRLMEKGAFSALKPAAMYVYSLASSEHSQLGILCGVATAAFEHGELRAHERVFGAQRDHLARHFEIVGMQSSPIVMSHADNRTVEKILLGATEGVPLLDFDFADGLHQTIWPIDDRASARIAQLLDTEPFYIIDGHHRTGAAHTYRQEVGPGSADFVLAAVFSSGQMRNNAFHRWLRHEDDCRWLLEGCEEHLDVRSITADQLGDRADDELAIYHDSHWLAVRLPSPHDGDALSNLDTVRLQRQLLGPLLGIDESAPRSRLDYVSGVGSTADLCAVVDRSGGALVLVRPVTMDELFAVADAKQIMPPKSTFFTPKARSGVVLRPM